MLDFLLMFIQVVVDLGRITFCNERAKVVLEATTGGNEGMFPLTLD